MNLINRAGSRSVALETTLLLHGVPKPEGELLAADLSRIAMKAGAEPVYVGVVSGKAIVGLSAEEMAVLFAAPKVSKSNTANLGLFLHRGEHAATTVSTTMELAAAAGVRVFATGGLGGVHRDYGSHLDISADLAAFTRYPVAVVTSGVKSILDVIATRELLETLGVPVVGYRTDRFPAFYLRESEARVDARFDDMDQLAAFVRTELARTGRGIVVANPIPTADEIPSQSWDRWLGEAMRTTNDEGAVGRDVTPRVLGHLHRLSNNQTLRANLALIRDNTRIAAELAVGLANS